MDAFALQLVKKVLTTPKSRQELLKKTKLPERTLRYNLSILRKEGLLKETPLFFDLRKKIFLLRSEEK